jgi:hypothetical protein
LAVLATVGLSTCRSSPKPVHGAVTVSVSAQPAATFRPSEALGGAIDGQDQGVVDQLYTAPNLSRMLSAGLGPVTYRLRTELGVEAWHWNPEGTWSDPAHQQGYWTSSPTAKEPIRTTFGYRLPRRGSTGDQANNDSYSRIDDGDPNSFWKSNPYLDSRYTGEDNARHPQWVLVDLGRSQPVDAVRLRWATPYAVDYEIQYWDGQDPFSISAGTQERWKAFPKGAVTGGSGGDVTIQVDPSGNTEARFVRVLMTRGSGTAPPGASDPRDSLGFALDELYVGTAEPDVPFNDLVRHGTASKSQSTVYVSSTDPWHRASDRDSNTEQPGFDRVLESGLLRGSPAVVPFPVLFSTPEDARTELAYLQARHFPIGRVELGEEPDGQAIDPEAFASLYTQFARTLHGIDPRLSIGGPSFQTGFEEVRVWPDSAGETSWLRRFTASLARQGAMGEFNFLAVEWYPFDDPCSPVASNLAKEPKLLADTFARWQADGIPASLPKLVTEYGYSAQAAAPEVRLEGALLNADFAAHFLTLGGTASYLYGYEPNILQKEPACDGWGNNMLMKADDNYQANDDLATYWGARLLTQNWAQPGDGLHTVYRATVHTDGGPAPVTAYAVHRPDGRWAVLVLNKDPSRAVTLALDFKDEATGATTRLAGDATLFQFGPAQYEWKANGPHGQTSRSNPPERTDVKGNGTFDAPANSISVLVGSRP